MMELDRKSLMFPSLIFIISCTQINQVFFIFSEWHLWVSALVGLTWENPLLDPLAVQHLNNQLYITTSHKRSKHGHSVHRKCMSISGIWIVFCFCFFNEGASPSIFELELPVSHIYVNHSHYRFELRKSNFFLSNRCPSREVLVQK